MALCETCYLTSCLYTASRNMSSKVIGDVWRKVKEERVPQMPGPGAERDRRHSTACFCVVISMEVLWILD